MGWAARRSSLEFRRSACLYVPTVTFVAVVFDLILETLTEDSVMSPFWIDFSTLWQLSPVFIAVTMWLASLMFGRGAA